MSDGFKEMLRARLEQQSAPEDDVASFLDVYWSDANGSESVRRMLEAHHQAGVPGLPRYHGALERYLEEERTQEEYARLINVHSNQHVSETEDGTARAWLEMALDQVESVLYE